MIVLRDIVRTLTSGPLPEKNEVQCEEEGTGNLLFVFCVLHIRGFRTSRNTVVLFVGSGMVSLPLSEYYPGFGSARDFSGPARVVYALSCS